MAAIGTPMGTHIAGQVVYLLCGLTSLGCTLLLMNRYRKTRADLLFWSALAVFMFTVTNILLALDILVFPELDFSLWRTGITVLGVLVLLFGLVRNSA